MDQFTQTKTKKTLAENAESAERFVRLHYLICDFSAFCEKHIFCESKKRGAAEWSHLFYLRVRKNYSATGVSAAGASAVEAAAFSAAGLRERRVLAAFFTVLAMFSS